MGDGVMIWAPDAGRAVALAAQTVEEVGRVRTCCPCGSACTPDPR